MSYFAMCISPSSPEKHNQWGVYIYIYGERETETETERQRDREREKGINLRN